MTEYYLIEYKSSVFAPNWSWENDQLQQKFNFLFILTWLFKMRHYQITDSSKDSHDYRKWIGGINRNFFVTKCSITQFAGNIKIDTVWYNMYSITRTKFLKLFGGTPGPILYFLDLSNSFQKFNKQHISPVIL